MLRDQEEAKALRLERRLTLQGYPHGPTLQVPSLLSHMSAREKWKALGNKVISKRRAERAFLPTADIPDHAAFAAAVKAWASILNKNKNSNVENQSSSNNAKAKYIKEDAISMSERRRSTRAKSDGSLSYKTAEDIDDHSNPMYCLPWQMAPCTWVMSMTCCIGASFVVGLYGLTFGYASSVAWLGSILYSLTQAHWVLEPLTLAASTLLMCWFQPAPIVPMVTQYIDYKDRLGEQLNEQKMSELEKQNIWRANYVPTMAYIKLIGHRLMMEKKIRRKLRESTLWAVLILVTFTLVYAHFHHLAFYMYSSVGNTLIHAVHSQTIAFDRVETYGDVWEYLQTTLVAATLLPSTRPEYNSYLGDLSNILVGMPRLRQVRYSPGKCDVGWRLPISVRCRNEYSLINDDSQSYTPGWRSVVKGQTYVPRHHSSWNYVDDDHDHGNDSFGVNDTDYDDDHHHDNNTEMMVNPWSYQSAWDLGVPLTLGAYNTYSGGGYIFEISANINETLEDLELLKAADWLNEDTAALIVELSVFNPVISMFMIVPLVFEFTQTGKVHPYYRNIIVCKLYNVVDVGDIYILLLQVVQVILVIIMCNRVYWLYHDDTHQFAVKLRNHWLEPLIILLNCMCLVTYAIKTWMVDRDVKRASEAKFRGFINWYEAAYWNYVYTYMGTVTTAMLLLNFLQVMSLNKQVLMFIRGLRKSLKQISGALVYVGLGIVILMIVGHIGTGTVLEESSTYSKTANTVLGMTIKDVNMDFKKAADSTSPYPAMFVVLTWVSIFCLFIPMIQVVVIHALKHARSQRVSTDLMEELEVAEYLFDHVLILLGWWGVDEFERKYERPLRFAALHDRSKNYPAAFKNSLLYELFGEESYTHVPKEDKEESDASSTDGSSKATSMWGKISAAMFSKKPEKKSKDKSKEKK